jgi:hypothetical protein
MKKIIFLFFAAAPIYAMEASKHNEALAKLEAAIEAARATLSKNALEATSADASCEKEKIERREEFLFWRFKEAVELWPTTKSNPSDLQQRAILFILELPPQQLEAKFAGRAINEFRNHLVRAAFAACMAHPFQRPDLQELQRKFKTLRGDLAQKYAQPPFNEPPLGEHCIAQEMALGARDTTLTLLKDVKKPSQYRYDLKDFYESREELRNSRETKAITNEPSTALADRLKEWFERVQEEISESSSEFILEEQWTSSAKAKLVLKIDDWQRHSRKPIPHVWKTSEWQIEFARVLKLAVDENTVSNIAYRLYHPMWQVRDLLAPDPSSPKISADLYLGTTLIFPARQS